MTVELMDVVVPIPITTKINTAKVIQKAKNDEESEISLFAFCL